MLIRTLLLFSLISSTAHAEPVSCPAILQQALSFAKQIFIKDTSQSVESPEEIAAKKDKENLSKKLPALKRRLLLKQAHKMLAQGDEEFLDKLTVLRIKKALTGPAAGKSVSLMLGNRFEQATQEQIEGAKSAAAFAIAQGHNVVFDADSTLAPYIAEIVGQNGIGISSGEIKNLPFKNYLVIKNAFLRMTALSLANQVAVNFDSLNGLALVLNSKATHYFTEKETDMKPIDFADWKPLSGENFGVSFKKIEWLALEKETLKPLFIMSNQGAINTATDADLSALYRHQRIMSQSYDVLNADARNSNSGYGAVVFGSGRYPVGYINQVYGTTRILTNNGISITTGGAGGVMEIGNQAGLDAGVSSTGIGISGRIKTEKESKKTSHTQTLEVQGYEQRIPLLLYKKNIIVIVPGGNGTMKELAATLVQESEATARRLVIFVGREYYAKIYADVVSHLPPAIAANYHLIDSEFEMDALVQRYKANVWNQTEIAELGTWSAPVPRNDNVSFTPKASPAAEKTPSRLNPLNWFKK